MNAGDAAELIAPFIDKSYPSQKDLIFRILKLGLNHAWNEGKWFGMSAELFVRVQTDAKSRKFIVSPHGYSTMLGLNVNGKATIPRDSHFMFHRNGYGDIKDHCACDWNTEDTYESFSPIFADFDKYFPNGAIIGVRGLSESGGDEKAIIQGETDKGTQISFEKININSSDCDCATAESTEGVRTVQGVEVTINRNLNYIKNTVFTNIDNIFKTHTRGVVEVYGFQPDTGKGWHIATLFPWDKRSAYKKYLIPNTCCDCVHGLFKIDKQPDIVDGSQPIIIQNEEAIIALAKGMHLMYHKDDINSGQAFILQGINSLEKQKREEEVADHFPIEVVGMSAEDTPEILRQY